MIPARLMSVARLACAFALAAFLSGCVKSAEPQPRAPAQEAEFSGQITGYNHTPDYIHRFYLEDTSGGNLFAYTGGGSFVCCIRYPAQWTPGLKTRVRWSTASSDPDATAEAVWHEALVPVDRYTRSGGVRVHFLPGGKVQVLVSNLLAGNPDYPGPAKPAAPADFKFKLQ